MGNVEKWKADMVDFASAIYRGKCQDIGVFPSAAREKRFAERDLTMSKEHQFCMKGCGLGINILFSETFLTSQTLKIHQVPQRVTR